MQNIFAYRVFVLFSHVHTKRVFFRRRILFSDFSENTDIESTVYDAFIVTVFKSLCLTYPHTHKKTERFQSNDSTCFRKSPVSSAFPGVLVRTKSENASKRMRFETKTH